MAPGMMGNPSHSVSGSPAGSGSSSPVWVFAAGICVAVGISVAVGCGVSVIVGALVALGVSVAVGWAPNPPHAARLTAITAQIHAKRCFFMLPYLSCRNPHCFQEPILKGGAE